MDQQVVLTALFGFSDRATEAGIRLLAGSRTGVGPQEEAAVVGPRNIVAPPGLRVVRTDPAVAERSLGCPCCCVRMDLHRALSRLIARRRPPAIIIVVGDPDTDPGPMLATLLCDPMLSRRTRLDAAVAVVDAAEAAVRLATGRPLPPTEEAAEQLALADAVILTRAATLTPSARTAVERAVRATNPFASLAMPDPDGRSLLWPEGADAYALGPVAARLDALPPCDGSNGGAVLVDLDGCADLPAVRAWMEELVRSRGADLLRLQAVCSLAGRSERWACSAVRSFYTIGLVAPSLDARPRVRVLAVGRNLDRHDLVASLRPFLIGQD